MIALSWLLLAAGPRPGGQPLAEVAGEVITVDDFTAEMMRRGGHLPGQYATVEQRRELLEAMIDHRALVAAARAAGYDRDPEVIAIFERAMVERFRQDRLDPESAAAEISDDEVARFYAEHQDEYARPERSRAALVFLAVHPLAGEEKQAELKARAEQALAEAGELPADVRHFGAVARKYSDDRASRYQGGVIGWLVRHPGRRYKWEPEVLDAVFALSRPGEIAPLVHTDKGYYLVRLVDREAAEARPLEQLADGIRHRLLRDEQARVRDALMTEVLSQVEIRIDDDLLAAIEPPTPPQEAGERVPPPMPSDPAGGSESKE